MGQLPPQRSSDPPSDDNQQPSPGSQQAGQRENAQLAISPKPLWSSFAVLNRALGAELLPIDPSLSPESKDCGLSTQITHRLTSKAPQRFARASSAARHPEPSPAPRRIQAEIPIGRHSFNLSTANHEAAGISGPPLFPHPAVGLTLTWSRAVYFMPPPGAPGPRSMPSAAGSGRHGAALRGSSPGPALRQVRYGKQEAAREQSGSRLG